MIRKEGDDRKLMYRPPRFKKSRGLISRIVFWTLTINYNIEISNEYLRQVCGLEEGAPMDKYIGDVENLLSHGRIEYIPNWGCIYIGGPSDIH